MYSLDHELLWVVCIKFLYFFDIFLFFKYNYVKFIKYYKAIRKIQLTYKKVKNGFGKSNQIGFYYIFLQQKDACAM